MGLLEVCLRWWALNRGWAAWVGLALALAAAALFSATSSKGPQGGRGGQGRGGARGGGEGGGGGEGEGGGGARVGAAGAARRRGGAAAARGQPGPTRARRVVLVSLLGTVLEQRTPEELAEEQSVAEGAPQALGRLLAAGCEVYLVARVADDTTGAGCGARASAAAPRRHTPPEGAPRARRQGPIESCRGGARAAAARLLEQTDRRLIWVLSCRR